MGFQRLLLVIACIYTEAILIDLEESLIQNGLVSRQSWTRIASCNSGEKLLLSDGRSLQEVQDLASTASIVLIYSGPYAYAMSSPDSYPIENLRGGYELSFNVCENGTLVNTPVDDSVWFEHVDSVSRMCNRCIPVETLRPFDSVAYDACGNPDGLYILDDGLRCIFDNAQEDSIRIYISSHCQYRGCTASNDTCIVTTCDTSTGLCSTGNAPNGIQCNDDSDAVKYYCQDGYCTVPIFIALDGCPRENVGDTVDFSPTCKLATELAVARCCTTAGDLCDSYTCSGAVTYSEAVQFCEEFGKRLCTAAELENDICCVAGCQYNYELAWSMDECEAPWIYYSGNEIADCTHLLGVTGDTLERCKQRCVDYTGCNSMNFRPFNGACNLKSCSDPCNVDLVTDTNGRVGASICVLEPTPTMAPVPVPTTAPVHVPTPTMAPVPVSTPVPTSVPTYQISPTSTLQPTPTTTQPPMPMPYPDPTLPSTSTPTGNPTKFPEPLPTTTLPTPGPVPPPTPAVPVPPPTPALPSPNPALPHPNKTEGQNHTYVVFEGSDIPLPQVWPYNATFNPEEFMIEFWTRPKHLTQAYLLKSENKVNATGYGLLLQEWTASDKSIDDTDDDIDDGNNFFWACEVFDGDKSFRVLSSQPAEVDVAVHLVCIYNDSQLVLYVNAEFQNSIDANLTINVDADLYIGENYNGTITHIVIYNTTTVQISGDTVVTNYVSSCSLYGFCEDPPLPTTEPSTSPPADGNGCPGTDGDHCSPLDPLNPYYAICFMLLILVLTFVAFCISQRRNKALAMHTSILIAGFSVLDFTADTSFTAQLTIEGNNLTVYAWTILLMSVSLNIIFMSKILLNEFKTSQTVNWFNSHVTAVTFIVMLSISNCDVMQLLYSRVHPALCAPIGHHSKKKLIMYSLVGHFVEDIPLWILQFIAVRSHPSTIIPFFSLVISSISIAIGITKRLLTLISGEIAKNHTRDLAVFGNHNNTDDLQSNIVQVYQVSGPDQSSDTHTYEETIDETNISSYVDTYESSPANSGIVSEVTSNDNARTAHGGPQHAQNTIPEKADSVYQLAVQTAQPPAPSENLAYIEMTYCDGVQQNTVPPDGHSSNRGNTQVVYDRVVERKAQSSVM